MIKAVVELAEELLIRIASIERSVMLPGHETNGLRLEGTGNIPKLSHTVVPRLLVFRDVSKVSGEHHEVGLLFQGVNRCNGLLECSLRVGIDGWPIKAPVRVRELDEVEFVRRCTAFARGACAEYFDTKSGSKHNAAKARQFNEISS